MLKQKTTEPDDEAKAPKSEIKDDVVAGAAAQKAKDVLAKLNEVPKRKNGRWEECCGVRRWVPD